MDADAPRPPYVKFEVRAVEDRTASVETGHYVSKDIVFALVTPAGTRDRLEKEADAWLEGIREAVQQERFPASWYDQYKEALARFRSNQEVPENGTPISNWPAVSPSQVRTLLDLNLRTIEDVATMNEEAVNRLGMGGRALKAKAQAYLDASASTGTTAAEIEELRQKNTELAARNDDLMTRLEALERLVPKDQPAYQPEEQEAELAEED